MKKLLGGTRRVAISVPSSTQLSSTSVRCRDPHSFSSLSPTAPVRSSTSSTCLGRPYPGVRIPVLLHAWEGYIHLGRVTSHTKHSNIPGKAISPWEGLQATKPHAWGLGGGFPYLVHEGRISVLPCLVPRGRNSVLLPTRARVYSVTLSFANVCLWLFQAPFRLLGFLLAWLTASSTAFALALADRLALHPS